MLGSVLLAAAFQIGPFYEQRPDYAALRPVFSCEGDTTDVLWPVFTSHRDWWRFCFFMHWQEGKDGYGQFDMVPVWFNGNDPESGSYWGLFPIYGRHPHIALMEDFGFFLWPLWTSYSMPRPSEGKRMESRAVLFPFFSWRDDGSWGVWPLCGLSHNRADDHVYALWPVFNRARHRPDRDTGGEGTSWMLWPLCGGVSREREDQWLFLPPLFSFAETPQGWRGRYPIMLMELERTKSRSRTSVFPFYESVENYSYSEGESEGRILRFGWRLVELYPDETRVFPFWAKGRGHFRLWPLWEEEETPAGESRFRTLALFPIRWADSIERNWSKFWTFYEGVSSPVATDHSLLWGIFRWRTVND